MREVGIGVVPVCTVCVLAEDYRFRIPQCSAFLNGSAGKAQFYGIGDIRQGQVFGVAAGKIADLGMLADSTEREIAVVVAVVLLA